MPATPSALTQIGVAKEITKGTGVVPTAWIPVRTFDPHDIVMYMDDDGMRGSNVELYGEIQGEIFSEIAWGGHVFPDTIPWMAAGLLGDIATVGGSAPYTHTMAIKNSTDGQPSALSVTDHYGLTGGTPARRFPGQQVSELGLKWTGDGMFEWTAKTVGWGSSQVAKPTATWTAIPPLPGWLGTISIAAANKLFMQSGEINFKRNATPIHVSNGLQTPYQVFLGPLTVDGKLKFIHEDDAELTRYLTAGGGQQATILNWTQGSGGALVQVQITMTKTQYSDVQVKRGSDFIETEVTFKAVANTTDVGASAGYSPAKVVVQNAVVASTYQ